MLIDDTGRELLPVHVQPGAYVQCQADSSRRCTPQSFGVGAAAVGTTLSAYALARLCMNIPSGAIEHDTMNKGCKFLEARAAALKPGCPSICFHTRLDSTHSKALISEHAGVQAFWQTVGAGNHSSSGDLPSQQWVWDSHELT